MDSAGRVAALYDVHGNLPALEAVLAEVAALEVDHVVVGGDVLPGPLGPEALARLRDLGRPTRFVRGNGEREVLAARDGRPSTALPPPVVEALRWVADELDDEAAAWIATWPTTARLEVEGVGRVLFCHGTPRSDSEIFTRLTPEAALRPLFADVEADLVVCGHTHMPFDRRIGTTRVVNAGSVGMPFGEPGAHWLLLGPGVEARRTDYDRPGAAERIRATRYPGAEDFATNDILSPRSADAALAALEKAAVSVEPRP